MIRLIGGLLAALAAALAPAAAAQAPVEPYRANDAGGFRNILPPGQNGLITGPQLALFLFECPPGGTTNCPNAPRPPHNSDQLAMYGDLVYAAPGLTAEDVGRYFKDASFGVRPDDVERTYSPRSDVTIVRDKSFGVPHIYGQTRPGAMFGAGYAGAEDRLFFMDVLRNVGRARLSSFVGGSSGNRAMDRDTWQSAPYTEADLEAQVAQLDDLHGAEGAQVQEDAASYIAGINQYIAEARLDPSKMPGEYAAIGRPEGPEDWRPADVIATAALIGGIFGKGGGQELDSALAFQAALERFGASDGQKVFADFRSAEDPEAPTHVQQSFPYQEPPSGPAAGTALPDPGSVEKVSGAGAAAGTLDSLLDFPSSGSNALVVSGAESHSGHPLAVFGPQTGYFTPQILMDIDIHGPGIDARGAAFPGINLYVQLGRGRDYAWSATSAGQDVIDTFAVELCEPGGGAPTKDSTHYRFRGQCLPIEVLERTNSWKPSPGDPTPPGSETLRAERTKLGIVAARATVSGKPVAYTRLRTTYMHEVDSAPAFVAFNDPNRIRSAADFQRAAHKVQYTFNWFYADENDIAYFNSGSNPVRAAGVQHDFPVSGDFEWQGFDPDRNLASYTPFEQHPQAVNPPFLTSWNNKQAPGFRAADGNYSFGPVHRVQPLDDRIGAGIAGSDTMTLPELVDAMETAGTVDLRADKVLPLALEVLGAPSDPQLADAVAKLEAWRQDGAHRRDKDRDGSYEHSEAIRILDAWWPLWIDAQFNPTLGQDLFDRLSGLQRLDNDPNNHGGHLGSAYQDGWYGFAHKDLRTLLGRPVQGAYSRTYCGGTQSAPGSLEACRAVLAASLKEALGKSEPEVYPEGDCEHGTSVQWCWDSIVHRPVGGATQPRIHWINRPTFQQAVEVPGDRPGGPGVAGAGGRRCARSSGRLRGKVLGPARLGRRRATQRRILGRPLRRRRSMDTFCLAGGGRIRIGYPSRRLLRALGRRERRRVRDRAVLILTTSKRYRARGLRPGASARTLRRRIGRGGAHRVGRSTWYLRGRRGSRLVFRVSRGRVREIGIADLRLTRRSLARRFLSSF